MRQHLSLPFKYNRENGRPLGRTNIRLFCSTLPTQEEIESLPAFPREKLSLRLLLGSGAFGEVYEGTAVDILGRGSGEIKVAVKVTWISEPSHAMTA